MLFNLFLINIKVALLLFFYLNKSEKLNFHGNFYVVMLVILSRTS
jgi:hypothetical protein